MRKFKCYNCGAICAVDDSVTQAQCPTCGTVCVLAPKAPVAPAPVAVAPVAPAPAPVAVAPVAPAPATQEAPAAPAPVRPAGKERALTSSEWSEKAAIFVCLKRYVAAKKYAELYSLIMNAPLPLARQALTAKVKCQFATFMFASYLGFLGVDRFYMGSIVAGVFKLLTGGGFGIWYFVDLFVSWQQCRTKNLKKIKAILQPAVPAPAPAKA